MKKGLSIVLCGLMSVAAVSQVVADEITGAGNDNQAGKVVELRLAANGSGNSGSSQMRSGTMTQRKAQSRNQVRTRNQVQTRSEKTLRTGQGQ